MSVARYVSASAFEPSERVGEDAPLTETCDVPSARSASPSKSATSGRPRRTRTLAEASSARAAPFSTPSSPFSGSTPESEPDVGVGSAFSASPSLSESADELEGVEDEGSPSAGSTPVMWNCSESARVGGTCASAGARRGAIHCMWSVFEGLVGGLLWGVGGDAPRSRTAQTNRMRAQVGVPAAARLYSHTHHKTSVSAYSYIYPLPKHTPDSVEQQRQRERHARPAREEHGGVCALEVWRRAARAVEENWEGRVCLGGGEVR